MTKKHIKRLQCLPALLVLLLTVGCSQPTESPEAIDAPDITRSVEADDISVKIRFSPGIADPREDVIFTVETRFPSGLQVAFPDWEEALEGFEVAATLSQPEVTDADGYQIVETALRLRPIPGSQYRIAPMLLSITENDGDPQYLITPAIRPPYHRIQDLDETPFQNQEPAFSYIPPTPREIMVWAFSIFIVLLVLFVCARLARRLKRKIEILRMSPAERARHELNQLLAKDLPAQGQFKEFFFSITGIIRTYIERQHGIRAPELTTDEFLLAATQRPQFTPEVVEHLREFLESADLVKFAAWTPTKRAIRDTIETARTYLQEDEETVNQGEQ